MKLFRPRDFVLFGMACLSGVVLLYTSQNVQDSEERLAQLEVSIAQEQERIKMLNAEWAHLNRPDRLEKLAQEFLSMAPVRGESLIGGYPANTPASEFEAPEFESPTDLMQPVSADFAPEGAVELKPAPRPVPKPRLDVERGAKDFQKLLGELGDGGGQ